MIKKLVSILLVALLALSLTGCSGGAPDDIIKAYAAQQVKDKAWAKTGTPRALGELVDFDVVNDWTEEVEGTTVFCYEYEMTITYSEYGIRQYGYKQSSARNRDIELKPLPEEDTYKGVIKVVQKGDKWVDLS